MVILPPLTTGAPQKMKAVVLERSRRGHISIGASRGVSTLPAADETDQLENSSKRGRLIILRSTPRYGGSYRIVVRAYIST